jgi:hypothetical protein
MINQTYVSWLVAWIQSGTINIATGKPFMIDDIKNAGYKAAVETQLNSVA